MVVVVICKRKEVVGMEMEEVGTCKHMVEVVMVKVVVVIYKCMAVEEMVMEEVVIYRHKVVEKREMEEVETCKYIEEVVMEKVVVEGCNGR